MTSPRRAPAAIRAAIIGAALALAGMACAQSPAPPELEAAIERYLTEHPQMLDRALESYIARRPDALRDALGALLRKNAAARAPTPDVKASIADNRAALVAAPLQTTLGALDGAPTLIEFFDFNCGYCRRSFPDLLALMADDPKLRVVMKDYPVLGPESAAAAKIALALQMRRPGPVASLEFYSRLVKTPGRIDGAAALKIAAELGFDPAQLEKDAESDEVGAALRENARLAKALGIRGTPAYVVGDSLVPGAVGLAVLKARVDAAKAAANGR